MRTKFKVDIHKRGKKNNDIITIISAHNGGEEPTSIPDLISYASSERSLYPQTCKSFNIERDEEESTICYVSEDGGKTFTLTIEEIEVHELTDTQDDLEGINVFIQ